MVPIGAKLSDGAFGVDRTRGLPPTKRLLHRLSYEGENENEINGARTMESNLGPPAYKAGALTG
jgi:hypothetical protein